MSCLQAGVDALEALGDIDNTQVLMSDVVANMSRFRLLGEEYEGARAIAHVEKRPPMKPVAKNFNFVMQGAVKAENIYYQIKTHARRIAEERSIPQNDRRPPIMRHLRKR